MRLEERRVGERAVELVEAAVHRAELLGVAEVPFADGAGGVAEVLHALGEGRLGERQAERSRGWPAPSLNSWPKRCW